MFMSRCDRPAPNAKYNDRGFVGQRFGNLVVKDIRKGEKHYEWFCECDCGKSKWSRAEYVYCGKSKSCGCGKALGGKKNKKIDTRLHRLWKGMLERCTDPKNPEVMRRYAGRGIRVCDEWQDYENFRDWSFSHGYNDALSIERIDNDAGYSPDNCKWIERPKQARNRCTTMWVEYQGRTMSFAEACEIAGVPYKRAFSRVKLLGWPIAAALETPVDVTRKWKRSERYWKVTNKL